MGKFESVKVDIFCDCGFCKDDAVAVAIHFRRCPYTKKFPLQVRNMINAFFHLQLEKEDNGVKA